MAKAKVKKEVFKKISPILIVFVVLFILLIGFKYGDCLDYGIRICLTAREYKNSDLPLSFKYPSFFPLSEFDEEWEIEQARKSGRIGFIEFSQEAYFDAGGDRLGKIIVSTTSGTTSIDDLAKDLSIPKEVTPGYIPKLPKLEKVTIGNNINALKISDVDERHMLSDPGTEYIFFKDGLKYSITFYYNEYHHKRPKSDYEKGFQFILDSLKVD